MNRREQAAEAAAKRFRLELCATCVQVLDRSVMRDAKARKREERAMLVGRALASGLRSLRLIKTIGRWKAPRAARWLDTQFDKALVKAILDEALADGLTPVARVRKLQELSGVGVPMASAILTCFDPENFTVIDVRALDTLGTTGARITPELYERYLEFCIAEAKRLGVELRQLDRALWKAGTIVS